MSEKITNRTEKMKAFVHAQNLEDVTKLEIDVDREPVLPTTPIKRKFEEDTLTEFRQKKTNKVGTKRVTVDLPEDIHRQFKMLVVELDTDMNALLNRLVEKIVAARNDE